MPAYIDETQIEQILSQLKSLRDELGEEVISLKHASKPVLLDQQSVGRVSRGDAMQHQNMAQANLDQCQERIRKIDEALHKIDAEEYGYCDECGNEIAFQRLQARPEASLCIDCQSKQEKAR